MTKINKTNKEQNVVIPPPSTSFHFPFMKYRGFFLALSSLFLFVSVYFISTHGFNFGVDFMGGIKLVYKFSSPIGDQKIREMLTSIGHVDSEVSSYGDAKDNSFLIKVRFEEGHNTSQDMTQKFTESLGAGQVTLLSEESVGPKVGADLRRRGILSVILTLVLILVYIALRFDFLFAPGAIIALIHDTAFALGVFTFFHKEFNLPILAAVLTLIGYSNNDTIIIYDRVRENLKKLPSSLPLTELIDRSLNETLSRSIVTHLTVLFAMIVLFVFGGGVIHDFAFFMIVGVIVGSYSSIFIASPIYILFHKFFPNKGLEASVKSTRRSS